LLRRIKEQVAAAVTKSIHERKVSDVASEEKINIPVRGVSEPAFRKAHGEGISDIVLPGNKLIRGDTIDKPEESGRQSGNGSGGSGDDEDDFIFTINRDEFLDIFFEQLELPDLVKKKLKETSSETPSRAGYSTSGSPQSIDITRTMRNSMARRLALHRPTKEQIEEAENKLAEAFKNNDSAEITLLTLELQKLISRTKSVPWIDNFDVKYRRFETHPAPISQAVMFCLMDVSGSMNQHKKDLAKRFFMLLYLFLQRRYKSLDIVFIRHTEEAKEVSEEEFFHSRESGGTVVSTALGLTSKIIKDRYPINDWNIYVAQASDSDNDYSDNQVVSQILQNDLLPICQYFAYLEVQNPNIGYENAFRNHLWDTYKTLCGPDVPLAMRKASTPADIFKVFIELFTSDQTEGKL
jgi:uncharacterized sporulation protein YeaH/YhbH (DUF444 family)